MVVIQKNSYPLDNCVSCKQVMRVRRADGDKICRACDKIEAKKDKAFLKEQKANLRVRKCRTCKASLPAHLYFRCAKCPDASVYKPNSKDFNHIEKLLPCLS